MNDIELDALLAIFGASHPGREHDALRTALARYERLHGRPCARPVPYFGRWTVAELRAKVRLPRTSQPACPECGGAGLVYIEPEDPSLDVVAIKCSNECHASGSAA